MKAFPTHSISVSDEARVTAIGGEGGMDLRDYFAAMAMSWPDGHGQHGRCNINRIHMTSVGHGFR